MPTSKVIETAPPPKTPDALFNEVYVRLKAMARRQRFGFDATLNTTALVHELYLKLSASRELSFAAPAQFFDYAAQAMRHILLDRARERMTAKRGGHVVIEESDAALTVADKTAERTLQLEMALKNLEANDARAARLVSLHYFGGLSFQEISSITGVATRTLNRDWRHARAFLLAEIG